MACFEHPLMNALGHNLPEDVQWRIFSFEQHPTATLIKALRFIYLGSPFANDPNYGLIVGGAKGVFKDLIKSQALRFYFIRPGRKELADRGNHFGIDLRPPLYYASYDDSDTDSDT